MFSLLFVVVLQQFDGKNRSVRPEPSEQVQDVNIDPQPAAAIASIQYWSPKLRAPVFRSLFGNVGELSSYGDCLMEKTGTRFSRTTYATRLNEKVLRDRPTPSTQKLIVAVPNPAYPRSGCNFAVDGLKAALLYVVQGVAGRRLV